MRSTSFACNVDFYNSWIEKNRVKDLQDTTEYLRETLATDIALN